MSQSNFPPVLFIPCTEMMIEQHQCIGSPSDHVMLKTKLVRAATVAIRCDFVKDAGDGFGIYRAQETGSLEKIKVIESKEV